MPRKDVCKVTRSLTDGKKLSHIFARLGKLYWDTGQFEFSIRYRHALVTQFQEQGDLATAAQFALLVANTYDAFVALGWDGEGVNFCVPQP